GFEAPDHQAWVDLVQQALKGASFDRLIDHTYDGIPVLPLYTADDVAGAAPTPPRLPYDAFLPWDIRQTVLNSDPRSANQVALHDLSRGVSSIEFCIDSAGACGVAANTPEDFATLTQGIMTEYAAVALSGAVDVDAARALQSAIAQPARAHARLAFNLDPFLGPMMGQAAVSMDDALAFAKDAHARFPHATCLRADARPVHEAGGSEGAELAYAIGAGIAFLQAGERHGLSPQEANQTLLFTLSTGPDVVLEIAKIKAARHLWAHVMAACGAAQAPMRLQAVTSGRMQTRVDPATNMLRATCANFAAGAAGADIITVLPFNSAYALADEKARRIARNTQLILQEETHLGRVRDPAAGAWAMEALAGQMAGVAWAKVQEIERAGGLRAALDQCLVQGWVASVAAARLDDVARGKTGLVGVTRFPNLDEDLPQWPVHTGAVSQKPANSLPPIHLSQDFEALRALPPKSIFLATLGTLAGFGPRVSFARNVFESGGIKALGGVIAFADVAAIVDAYEASGADLACICGADADYASGASALARALKAKGCKLVFVAGKGPFEGVDRCIFRGCDLVAELKAAHASGAQTL
ncbi:MAG: hypothetical protein RLZZ157_1881, partial [Pseudomonadota bacterium]